MHELQLINDGFEIEKVCCLCDNSILILSFQSLFVLWNEISNISLNVSDALAFNADNQTCSCCVFFIKTIYLLLVIMRLMKV